MDRVNEMCGGRPTPLLIDMATTESVSRAARAVFAKRCDASAIALLGSSPVELGTFANLLPGQCPRSDVLFHQRR